MNLEDELHITETHTYPSAVAQAASHSSIPPSCLMEEKD